MVLVITNPLLAQLNKCTFEKEVYISGTDTLLYQIFKPINTTKKVPLVLFLHGSGERGNDNEKQLIHSIDKFTTKQFQTNNPCYIIAPQCPDNKQWVDVDWGLDAHTMPVEPTIQMKLTIELVKQLSKQLNIDTNRIYITGLSMGGFGVWDAISRNPEIFAAAVPVCGGGDEKMATIIKNVPIWAFHGAKDKVVKTIRTQNMINALKKAGAKPIYTEYPNAGHGCWVKAYSNQKMMNWLFSNYKLKK